MRPSALLAALALSCAIFAARAQQLPVAIDLPAGINQDPPADQKYPAAMDTFLLPSHGSALNAIVYVAAGKGPHPVVVLLHGFPGNEKNLDLAQAIRRAGWDVLFFNYRGSWGSPGDFSFTHGTEDVAAALAYLREPANAIKLREDAKRVVLIGHSMGGFMAAYGGAHDPAVVGIGMISAADFGAMALSSLPAHAAASGQAESTAVAKIAPDLAAEGMAPLSGCTPESLARDMLAHRVEWDFTKYAPLVGKRPVLLVTSNDGLAPASDALGRELIEEGNQQVTAVHFATDHSYSDKRIALEAAVLRWLAGLP